MPAKNLEGRYDLIVVGSGTAGAAAATKTAAHGWRVAVVDDLPYGGTCALRGCDPKKILRRGAEVVDAARLLRGKGIDDDGLSINWADLMKHKQGFTDPMPHRIETSLERSGVVTLHGPASFQGPTQLAVGNEVLTGDRFLVATGAHPRPLDFPGAEHLVDSTQFLDLDALPARILFVGGGFISFEFAHITARTGSSPIIVDHGPRPLKSFDPDLVDLLLERSHDVGIRTWQSTAVTAVEPAGAGYRVHVEHDGRPEVLDVDLVVHGAGRQPDLARLDLDAAGAAWTTRGVTVADHLRSTTNPAIYAAGDAADSAGMPLTPVAAAEGKVVASNMLHDTTTAPDYTGIPTAVFTIPELTRVGLLEHEARDQGIDLDVRYTDTSGWYSNYRLAETTAAVKILVDRATDHIVGAHLLGPEYAELVNTFGMAMKLGLTTRQLRSMTATYPTVGSDLGSML
ncbi:NAD(P)/FAD-dependent oxidoreductase [Isoptericola halotolerans]|uniref:dihydrolipoyl dehydrogenase family protein n=1 Tax=Isoptericola halotolerans TaxID=300560 RepID=UPI00388F1B02